MNYRVRAGALAAALGISAVAGAARAADEATGVNSPATEPSREQVMQELQALRDQVRQLEQRQTKQDEKLSAAEVDATVAEVIDDADRRSQLLQAQGFTAGWSKGKFLIQSEDGNFVLNPGFWFQPRYVISTREEDAADEVNGDYTTEQGFEIRRMKFIFEGNAFTKNLKYKFQWNTNRSNGNAFLEDAFVSYRFGESPWGVKLGQYKEPTFHEELMSDVRQLTAERSLVNFVIGGGNTDRVQGIAAFYDAGPEGNLRGEVGFTDGPNSDNTNFTDGGGTAFYGQASPDFGAYGRAEYKVMGDWKSYDDFTALGTTNQLLVVGGGASYAQSGDNNLLLHTVDAQFETGPVGLYAAYYGAYTDQDGGSGYDAGVELQAGYLLSDKWEVFGRYELMMIDDDVHAVADDMYHVMTAGVNYYLRQHAAKFTVDLQYLPNGSPTNFDGGGVLDPDGDTDQLVLRAQFQLLL